MSSSEEKLPLPQYLWRLMQNTTKVERLSCAVVFLLVMLCVALLVYYYLVVAKTSDEVDESHGWYTPRTEWLGVSYPSADFKYKPIKLVVIQHTVTRACTSFTTCASEMRSLQSIFISNHDRDVPYNFLVGNDGRVYEGRGWMKLADHSRRFNPCSISVAFIGDYRYYSANELQINRTRMLLDEGVKTGYLDLEYLMVGAKDFLDSESPGTYLYSKIQTFEHYDHKNRYRYLVCEQIYASGDNEFVDEAPSEWYLNRKQWKGSYRYYNNYTHVEYVPLRLVIIVEQPTRICYTFVACQSELQNLQSWYFLSDHDLPFNFIVANDGRVYQARGWGVEGDTELIGLYHSCALVIGFLGEYTENSSFKTELSDVQVNRTHLLLGNGVKKGWLHPEYVVMGARDLLNTTTPSDNLYRAIKLWDHYDNQLRYRDKSCEEINKDQYKADIV